MGVAVSVEVLASADMIIAGVRLPRIRRGALDPEKPSVVSRIKL